MGLVDDQQRQLLTQLYPSARAEDALESLITAERERRGAKDRSGACARSALVAGPLLDRDYDHSLHGHTGWKVEALIIDVHRLIRFNVRYGFSMGDAVLREVVSKLEETLPKAKVVRIHADAFAALFTPWSEVTVDEALRARALDALQRSVIQLEEKAEAQRTTEPEGPRPEVAFTAALLRLEIFAPSHWQVLGPLVWAEAERALVLQRTQPTGVQHRKLNLEGNV
ncbi:MAG: diguanylate cyclase domain-containing protein [Myxococcaceae bacterium]